MASYPTDLADLQERRRQAKVWAEAAARVGMTHALTLNPDRLSHSGESPAGLINSMCKSLFRKANQELRCMSRREAETSTSLDFLGVYELRDERGLVYPHGHFALRLEAGEVWQLEVLLADCWGSKPSGEGDCIPARKPIDQRLGRRAQSWLTPIHDVEGWARYVHKQITGTTGELDVYPRQFLRRDALLAA